MQMIEGSRNQKKMNLSSFELPANSDRFWQQLSQLEGDYPAGANLVEAMFCFQRCSKLIPLVVRSINTVLAVHSGCMGLTRKDRCGEFLLACREAYVSMIEQLRIASDVERETVLLLLEGRPGIRADYFRSTRNAGPAELAEMVFGLEELRNRHG